MGLIKGRMGRLYKPLAILEPQSTIGGLKVSLLPWNGMVRSFNTSLDIGSCTNGLAHTELTIALRCMGACS